MLLRQDPPFDMAYITTTHLLERIHPKTLVVNDPAHVRNAPEKVFVLDFLDLMPPTLVTRNPEDVKAFRAEHKDIILKPLYGNGGSSVFRVGPGDTNLNSLVELFQTVFREPFMVQQYRPEVRAGDKRIILVDGEVVGRRQPRAGGRRDALQPARRRHAAADRAHAARPGDLRAARARAEAARAAVHRHRRDRPLPDRDQRHLADRHPAGEGVRRRRHRRPDLGCDREESEEIRSGRRDHALPTVCQRTLQSNSRRSIMAIKILGIAGSLRKASFNKSALKAAQGLVPAGATLEVLELPDLPGFNQDNEKSPPAAVTDMKAKIRAADAILLVTPEYNYSIPGVFKNAIDWCARPYGDSAWKGKPAAIMGASAGVLGTGRAQYDLRKVHGLSRHAGGEPARGDDLGGGKQVRPERQSD